MKKAIVIDSEKQSVELVEKEWTLNEMQETVDGFLEAASIGLTNVSLFVNEDFLFNGNPNGFILPGVRNGVILGNAVLIGLDQESGESVSLKEPEIMLGLIRRTIRFGTTRAVIKITRL